MSATAAGPEPAETDPLAEIRRHLRSITNELRRVDQANPGAEVITYRMRGAVDVLTADLGELRYFLPRRPGD